MATVSSSTGGAIDVQSIVSQLMAVESQPLTKIQTRMSGVQTEVSAFGQLQGALANVQTAAQALNSLDTWSSRTATSSDTTAVTASATSSAAAGTYDVSVTKLAQRQTMASTPLAASTTVMGGGTLKVQIGTLNAAGTLFTANAASPEVPITIAAGSTISQVRDAINAAGAGVTASLVTDTSGVRLLVRSDSTGLSNAVKLSVTDGDGTDTDTSGLSQLSFDPTGTKNMLQTVAPQNAQFTLNGLNLTSATNTISDAIENVTLNLTKEGGSSTVTVAPDTGAMRKALDTFISAYNTLTQNITSLTAYNPTTKAGGPLQGNTTVMMIQRQLRSTLQAVVGNSSLGTLNAAGIRAQRDGTLAVNDTQWASAAADPAKLKALFYSSDAAVAANNGIARRLNTLLTGILGSDGAVSGATTTLQKQQTTLKHQQTDLQARLTQIQARLTKQYTALDTNMSKMGSIASFLTSKFG